MTLPDFLLIGAARSGTTSLNNYLGQHPEIFICPKKESSFFALEGHPRNFAGPPADISWFNPHIVTAISDYQSLFNGITSEKVSGEASVLYLYSPIAARNIYRYLPNAKLLAILRNPAERAYSNFMFQVSRGHETILDFQEALYEEPHRIAANWRHMWHYKQLGFYYQQVRPYFELFGRDQIRVYLYEDYIHDPLLVLKDIFSFLQVDETFHPDLVQLNVSGLPKSKNVDAFLTSRNILKSMLKSLIPQIFGRMLRNKIFRQNLIRPEMSAEIRRALLAEYRTDILSLQDLLGRDLGIWLSEDIH